MRWQEHAHLFANGKFKFMVKEMIGEVDHVCEVISYRPLLNEYYLTDGWDTGDINAEKLVLIARPISDMTDEEEERHKELKFRIIVCSTHTDAYKQAWKAVDYLLSIGVYPFDQSHFDDGTVIDGSKLEEA